MRAFASGPDLSRRNQEHQVYPYLLRGLSITVPNHVWGIDITHIRLHRRWMYLVAIIDWYSRYVLAAVRQALAKTAPAIMNSDQGSHFTSPAYIELLRSAGVQMHGR